MSNQKTDKDRLTAIFGLGRASMARLNEAGIYTFQQLVDTEKWQIAEITRRDVHAVGEWVDSAMKFLSGEWAA